MKLAMLGGTFNPPHNGHINLGEIVRREFHYDRILFVPSYNPAHKEVKGNVTAKERLEMLALSLKPYSWADYSDCEIRRRGVSYTVDTLEYLYREYKPEEKPGLIIGDDLAENFLKWRSTERIFELADLIVAHRLYKKELDLPFPHRYARNEIFSLSSSDLRQLAASGEDISSYIPFPASEFINERRFYVGHPG
jgi:nicotinate-nucleotide adenylyltransferase